MCLIFFTKIIKAPFKIKIFTGMRPRVLVYCGLMGAMLFGFISVSTAMTESDHTTVGRYLTIPNQPLAGQRDLLKQTRQVTFPAEEVDTVEAALRYLLLFSGYTLAPLTQMDSSAQAMLGAPLPEIDRSFGPMSLQDGLETLAGESFALLIDPIHRIVSFKLKPSYQILYQTDQEKQKNSSFSETVV